MELFPEYTNLTKSSPPQPLAARMRPDSLENYFGQEHLIGKGLPLRELVETESGLSFILWGPPGSGKTTLARIAAKLTESKFHQISAVNSGVADIRKVVQSATEIWKTKRNRTILFLDEIHRFNKTQQDAVLPFVENGTIRLIGSTTENPSFEVIPALRSRCQIFRLETLDRGSIRNIILSAVSDKGNGLGKSKIDLQEDALELIVSQANGDARRALNVLEAVHDVVLSKKESSISLKRVEGIIQRAATLYDKKGGEHYDHASAFQKSLRGSDPDAAIYWLAKMIAGGEDPRFIVRRLLVTATEDVGNADPQALLIALAAAETIDRLGLPEARISLAQAVIYIAKAPKSNVTICAIDSALDDIQKRGRSYQVPNHLKDTHYQDAKAAYGYGVDYKYPHDYPGSFVKQDYLPEALKNRKYVEDTKQDKKE
jgi:putative ATPase